MQIIDTVCYIVLFGGVCAIIAFFIGYDTGLNVLHDYIRNKDAFKEWKESQEDHYLCR